MKTLRARLFIRVGVIFLLVALLSFYVPQILVRGDIDHASKYLNQIVSSYHKKIQLVSRSWVNYRFLHMAAQLDATTRFLEIDKSDLWEQAAAIIRSDPEIAIVQIEEENKVAVIYLEAVQLHVPQWALDHQQTLWIKTGNGETFIAKPLGEKEPDLYLLFAQSRRQTSALPFSPFSLPPEFDVVSNMTQKVYAGLQWKENLLLEKTDLVEKLLPWRQMASGILKVTKDFKEGVALLNSGLFFQHKIVEDKSSTLPFVFYEKEGPFIDFVQWAPISQKNEMRVLIGYSISTICSEMAKTVQKPILLYDKKRLLQGFTSDGGPLPLEGLSWDKKKILWQGIVYIPSCVNFGSLIVEFLTPASEINQISYFLTRLRDSLIEKISLNLLLVTVMIFGFALLLLARISKRMTEPIALLAHAAEEIGQGKYEGLTLPDVEKRRDEIATLSHSFQKMVLSLRDREKIRGVLNKVVSKEIASRILSTTIELGGEERVLSILFNDIRGFTPLSETMPPKKLIALLNNHMTRMCQIVDETHGVVDKFVGDEIMALYGAPIDLKNHADMALKAAFLMLEDLKKWNQERGDQPMITVGIGIHTGVAFAGNMGAENRLNYTVVGANVNLAARLCSAAKPMEILISEQTFQALSNPQAFSLQKLPPIRLKGIDEPIPVYRLQLDQGDR